MAPAAHVAWAVLAGAPGEAAEPGPRAAPDEPAHLPQPDACLRLQSRVRYVAAPRSLVFMIAVEFTRDELDLVHHALSAFLADFGHKEKDVVHSLRELLGKIPAPAA